MRLNQKPLALTNSFIANISCSILSRVKTWEEKSLNILWLFTDVASVKVNKDMKAPIYIYYQLDNYYQNHRCIKSQQKEHCLGKLLPSQIWEACLSLQFPKWKSYWWCTS